MSATLLALIAAVLLLPRVYKLMQRQKPVQPA
jgi:hypothetical protein